VTSTLTGSSGTLDKLLLCKKAITRQQPTFNLSVTVSLVMLLEIGLPSVSTTLQPAKLAPLRM
jgi:hypothetical protein